MLEIKLQISEKIVSGEICTNDRINLILNGDALCIEVEKK